jgi:hypothetical protein
MTLLLTDVSKLGVAMAADSAVTFGSGRVYVGAQKLLPAYSIDAGLSVWGRGDVAGTDADEWLGRFIGSSIDPGASLWEVATLLADRLNHDFGGVIHERMGVHVAGFDQRDGTRGPAFYHVHNGHYKVRFSGGRIVEVPGEQPPIREFRAHDDRPPRVYTDDDLHLTSNGDFGILAYLLLKMQPILGDVTSIAGLAFPYPRTLTTRGEYLRFWIHVVKEVYRLSDARPGAPIQPPTVGDASIGGPISVLTISDSGIQHFYAK